MAHEMCAALELHLPPLKFNLRVALTKGMPPRNGTFLL